MTLLTLGLQILAWCGLFAFFAGWQTKPQAAVAASLFWIVFSRLLVLLLSALGFATPLGFLIAWAIAADISVSLPRRAGWLAETGNALLDFPREAPFWAPVTAAFPIFLFLAVLVHPADRAAGLQSWLAYAASGLLLFSAVHSKGNKTAAWLAATLAWTLPLALPSPGLGASLASGFFTLAAIWLAIEASHATSWFLALEACAAAGLAIHAQPLSLIALVPCAGATKVLWLRGLGLKGLRRSGPALAGFALASLAAFCLPFANDPKSLLSIFHVFQHLPYQHALNLLTRPALRLAQIAPLHLAALLAFPLLCLAPGPRKFWPFWVAPLAGLLALFWLAGTRAGFSAAALGAFFLVSGPAALAWNNLNPAKARVITASLALALCLSGLLVTALMRSFHF